jgi:gliding motility-associated-like protein/uncharacterized repeat protein (TIGR01451 family)
LKSPLYKICMKKNLFTFLLILFTFQLYAADYYWVGGGGNWSDVNHWRLGSTAGSIPSIVPAAGDNVFFTAGSGFGATTALRTVTMNANAFCNNMTWDLAVPNNPVFTRVGTSRLSISGNLTLAPTITFTSILADMVGSTNAVLTANGNVLGSLSISINKPGSGVTLADNLIYAIPNGTANYVDIAEGYFNASGKTITAYAISSNRTVARNLDISNAKVNLLIYNYQGTNKVLNASNSILKTTRFYADEGTYYIAEIGTTSLDYLAINNITCQKITFITPSATSDARIHSNNIIDTLLFLGSGGIRYGNNKINHVEFNGQGGIGGAGNIIKFAEAKKGLNIIDGGGNVFDTLLTAANNNLDIRGTNTINKYFRAGGLPCDGFTEITGSASGTLAFAPGAVADIDNVLLTNMTATGSIAPITVNGIDNDGNTGFVINEPAAAGTTLYWVNGGGDWNDKNHWSTSSGGAPGACIPFIGDNVVFDANSGFTVANNIVATTGNTYCKNMSWLPGVPASPILNESASFYMSVYGSVVLEPTVRMNAGLDLRGTTSVTLTVNGSALGSLQVTVRKSDPSATSGLRVLDNWSNTAASLVLARGVLDLHDRSINIGSYVSNSGLVRSLNINKAKITMFNWTYNGFNKSMDAANSTILVTGNIISRDVAYNIVECSASHPNFDISNTTFGYLLFSNPAFTSGARIGGGNIIRRLEFKGQGLLRFTGNAIDSLITAENRNFYFYEGTTSINKYFKATHPSCSGLGEIRTGGTTGTIVFAPNTVVDISNVYMENIAATGGSGSLTLPIPFNGADAGGNSGWTISSSAGNARYWVGAAGDWNDASHWSTTSGGTGGACIPTIGDDVFFDGGSGFTAASKTITVSAGNAYFRNMSWSGALNAPILNKSGSWNMEGWGSSIILNPAVTLNISTLRLMGPSAVVMSGETKGDFDLEIYKAGSGFTLANDYNNALSDFYIHGGYFNVVGRTLTAARVDNGALDNPVAIDISGSTINVGLWRFSGVTTKRSLNAANSVINGTIIATGFTYDVVNVPGVASGIATINNTIVKQLTLTDPNVGSAAGINGANNTIGRLEYKGSGSVYGTGNVIDTLIFFPGNIYQFAPGTNTTVTGEWFGSGTPCRLTEIKSGHATLKATITKTSGTVDFDYIRLKNMTATGGGAFNVKEHSTDQGGNTGWAISPYNGAAPILGLGQDKGLKNSEFPYTIKTDGFFGSPLSLYEWKKDGNVISTADKLTVTEPGIYSVKVMFPDGCSITDDITLSLVSTDLAIEKSVDNPAPVVAANVVFTLKATNEGPGAGTGITVTDQLPTGYTYISDTAPVGTTYDAVTGLWTIGNLASGANAIITITAKVNATGIYANTAIISSAGDDPDPANNSSTVTIVPSPTAIITQPTCAVETGTIEVPLASGGTYSIDGGTTFQAGNSFANLEPGDYSIVVKIGANTSTPVTITINEAPSAPDAPLSGGNQLVCETNPIQTLTATATVSAGSTIVWYDAPSGGNIVANPILNTIGTIVYYAETNNGTCTSKSRTAVVLSINISPVIAQLANQAACTNYTLPVITGTNLTGNQAYFTLPNGGGTKYPAGTVLSTIGTQTLYLFDKSVSSTACAGNIDVTPNTSLSDNVFIHQYISASHNFYPRAVNADFWKGTADQLMEYRANEGAIQYLNIIGDLNVNSNPACTGSRVEITVGATFRNEGPAAGAGYSGLVAIYNKVTGQNIYTKNIQADFKVGVSAAYTATAIVPAADLLAGNLIVVFAVETAQNGYKNWTLSKFNATYKYVSETPCPDEKSFELTINPLPLAPVNNGNQEVCAVNPMQTLTATATVPSGTTIIWYDAATGGNIVAAPILNTLGTIIYYAEAVSNTCGSATRTPVTLTINQSPTINAIADINACGPLTLPAITGSNLSGTQAYYTGVNKTGTKYNPGDVFSTTGETTLYAYDEILVGAAQNPEGDLSLTNNVALGYTNAKLQALWPDQTRVFPRTGTFNGTPGAASSFAAFPTGSPASVKFSAVVAKLTLPVGYTNAGDQVLISIGDGFIRSPLVTPPAFPGYAGQLAIINTATNQLLYQSSFGDIPATSGAGVRPSVSGLVSAADLIAGNIDVYIEFIGGLWRISGLTAKYQFVSNGVGCPAQQSFKVNINPIPAAPVANNQTVCADSPIQTLTAVATVPSGSTVVWYNAASAGTVVANPILNTIGTVTYYAETHTGTCVSATRAPVVLTINASPVLSIHNPAVVCHPGTINLTAAAITTGSTVGLTLAYFKDAAATDVLVNPSMLAISGTYYIKGTNPATGCSIIAPVVVQFVDQPEVTAVHPDCVSATGTIKITAPLGPQFTYTITPTNGGTVTPTADNTVFTISSGTYEVTASNTTVPGCVSTVTNVVINIAATTAMPLVFQPDCDETTGRIEFPVNANYQYSIDGDPFVAGNVFTLAVGSHTIKSKKAGDACEADAVTVTIVASAGRPGIPTAADQQACATSPVQTLAATAAVAAGSPVGSSIKWYDAPTAGNRVSLPTLSSIGTVVYYAESTTGTCASLSRKPVRLTIIPVPVINFIADKNVCGSLTLPIIAGANLSGNQAYYTAANGGGTKYNAGAVFSTAGETTLYAYDVNLAASPGTSCPAETNFKVLIRNTTAGSITVDQTICKNTAPAALASATDGTGLGSLKYKWERSTTDANSGFNVITGATLETYTPAALTATTWFRRTTLSFYDGVECESAPTVAVQITVQDAVTAGVISASQTICNGSSPIAFTSVTNATGSGMISYRWESSITDATNGFTTVVGVASAGYSPSALATTTWFRRIAISTANGQVCESVPTTAVKVTVQDVVTAGTISAGQTICNNTGVGLISLTAGTGSGSISYRWEKSTTSAIAGFAVISGAVMADYTPTALTATTYFRRITISLLTGVTCESVPTTVTTITVQDEVTAGVIGANQTICTNTNPAALTSVTAGTGSGNLTYRWEQSSASVPAFTAVAGVTSAGYTPGALAETTWFRRITISSLNGVLCESVPTAIIEITVQDATSPGTIAASQTICNGSTPEPLTSGTAGTGSGTITYRWESSTTDALNGFAIIPAATLASYAPGALTSTTYFRRITVSTLNGKACESLPTAVVTISVQGVTTAGTIGTDQVICNNTVPAALSSITVGTGSGTISYRWERSSFATTGFVAITGATADNYSPAALTTTVYFRRITISTQSGVACESVPTPVVKITVQGATSGGIIGADQTICFNTVPAELTSITAGSGSGTIIYRWESSTANVTTGFAAISGANSTTYTPTALTGTTYFRRITISTEGGKTCESVPTNVVTITVQDAVTAGVISTNQTICNNTAPVALTTVADGTGSGTITYRWESSTTSATNGFAAIAGATVEDYSPATLTTTTYFRRITVSTLNDKICESAPTAVVTITVQGTVTAGTIAGDQVICKASIPVPLTSTAVGTGLGTISYRWESSTAGDNTDFTAIAGVTGAGYSPAALTTTTYFRRITISTVNGVACESVPTAAVSVSPNSAPIGTNQNKNTDENTMIAGQVTGTDVEGGVLTYSTQSNPLHGTAVVNTDGSYTYTPNLYYAGNDSFTIGISDGCSITVITINITVKITSAPSISLVKTGVFAQNYITYSFAIKNTGNIPLYSITLGDAKLGIVSKTIDAPGGLLSGATITVTEKYTLTQADKEAGNVNNTATVNAIGGARVAVSDVSGTAENNSTPTVTGVTKPFVAVNDNYEGDANKVIKENLLVNDDLFGQPVISLTVETVTLPQNGKLILNADGTFIYTPNPGYIGSDSYTYRIKDEYGYYSNVATVSFQANFFDIKMPTLFTPNGDGVNDTFEIRGLNQFAENELVIVNRWGNEVYRMKNYQNDWSGISLNEGTYYYLLKVKKTSNSEWVIFKGYTTIVRAFKK